MVNKSTKTVSLITPIICFVIGLTTLTYSLTATLSPAWLGFPIAAAGIAFLASAIVTGLAWRDVHEVELYQARKWADGITPGYVYNESLRGLSDMQARLGIAQKIKIGVVVDHQTQRGSWYFFTHRGAVPWPFVKAHILGNQHPTELWGVNHYSDGQKYEDTGQDCRLYAKMMLDELEHIGWIRQYSNQPPAWVSQDDKKRCYLELDLNYGLVAPRRKNDD